MQLQTTMLSLASVFFDLFFSFFALFFRAREGWLANRVTQTKNVSAEVAEKKKRCTVSVALETLRYIFIPFPTTCNGKTACNRTRGPNSRSFQYASHACLWTLGGSRRIGRELMQNMQTITLVVVVLIVVNCLNNICDFELLLFLI